MKRRVLIWDTSISNMLEGKIFGGIAVQLYFWSQVFVENQWEVYSITNNEKNYIKQNIHFMRLKPNRYFSIIIDFIVAFFYVLKIKPDLIMMRGATNRLYNLSILSYIFGIKLVFMGASDVNFEPGKEQINNNFNRKLYQCGLKKVKYVITQNQYQTQKVIENYNKKPLQLNSIWGEINIPYISDKTIKKYDIVWIANIRKLKRLEWILESARKLPQYSFAIAGKFSESLQYEKKLTNEMSNIQNLEYLGNIGIAESNKLVKEARLLVCTSEFEGFPNTFLQAWSMSIPVISTVNPNDIILRQNLGFVVKTIEELVISIEELLSNKDYYVTCQNSILKYFNNNHNSLRSYYSLINYLKLST